MHIDLNDLRARLPATKQIATDLYGVQWKRNRAKCPRPHNHAHGDRDPSFAYLPKTNRLQCFSQDCFGAKPVDAFDFVMQMDSIDFGCAAQRLSDRYGFPTVGRNSRNGNQGIRAQKPSSRTQLESDGWRITAEYQMGEGVRKLRLEHPDRLQPGKNRPDKTFIWEHRADNGTWIGGKGDRPHFAYVNSPFRERDQIESALGVESERSADTVGELGFPAFSFKEITAANAVAFAGLDLRLLPDKDAAGAKLMLNQIERLKPHARSIAVIDPPGDWPEAGRPPRRYRGERLA